VFIGCGVQLKEVPHPTSESESATKPVLHCYLRNDGPLTFEGGKLTVKLVSLNPKRRKSIELFSQNDVSLGQGPAYLLRFEVGLPLLPEEAASVDANDIPKSLSENYMLVARFDGGEKEEHSNLPTDKSNENYGVTYTPPIVENPILLTPPKNLSLVKSGLRVEGVKMVMVCSASNARSRGGEEELILHDDFSSVEKSSITNDIEQNLNIGQISEQRLNQTKTNANINLCRENQNSKPTLAYRVLLAADNPALFATLTTEVGGRFSENAFFFYQDESKPGQRGSEHDADLFSLLRKNVLFYPTFVREKTGASQAGKDSIDIVEQMTDKNSILRNAAVEDFRLFVETLRVEDLSDYMRNVSPGEDHDDIIGGLQVDSKSSQEEELVVL
jgi:hypothetical protein